MRWPASLFVSSSSPNLLPSQSSQLFFSQAPLCARETNDGDGSGSTRRKGDGSRCAVSLPVRRPITGAGGGETGTHSSARGLCLPHAPNCLALAGNPARAPRLTLRRRSYQSELHPRPVRQRPSGHCAERGISIPPSSSKPHSCRARSRSSISLRVRRMRALASNFCACAKAR